MSFQVFLQPRHQHLHQLGHHQDHQLHHQLYLQPIHQWNIHNIDKLSGLICQIFVYNHLPYTILPSNMYFKISITLYPMPMKALQENSLIYNRLELLRKEEIFLMIATVLWLQSYQAVLCCMNFERTSLMLLLCMVLP